MRCEIFRVGAAMLVLAAAGCRKNEAGGAGGEKRASAKTLTVEVVGENERSNSFLAVNRQLELGGTLYGYVDVDGDILSFAGDLQALLAEIAKADPKAAPFAKQDYAELARMLGLTDVKAFGVSSVPDGTGYFRNRLFVYTGGERHGLMAALGGKPGPFKHVHLAPADASFYGESELDSGIVYRTIKDVLAKIAGEPAGSQLESTLRNAGEAAMLSLIDLVYGLKGRTALVVRVHPERTLRVSGNPPLIVPAFSLLACVEGVAPVVEQSLARSRGFRRTESGGLRIYEATRRTPYEGIEPVVVADGSTLYLASSLAFFIECREQQTSLAETAEFQRAVSRVGNEGNGLTFISPRLFERLREFERLNPELPAASKAMLRFALSRIPEPDQPLVSIRTNVDDGILVRSYSSRSLKQEVVAVSVYNPMTIGLLAAMAIPAFQKVQMASQEKAVLNNLRMLAAAAERHYLETGTRTATYDQLVGPARAIKAMHSVAGENYRAIRFVRGEPLRVRLASGKMVEYGP